jgi:murein DD-endopeptidase MepM/ murein hydrolase activator NlpD
MRTDRLLSTAVVTAMLVGHSIPASQAKPADDVTIALSGRAQQPGEVVRVVVGCSCASGVASATVFGRDVPLERIDGGWEGLIGIDLDVAPAAYTVTARIERKSQPPLAATRTLRVTAKRFPTRHLRVAPEFVNPPVAELQRISDEARAMAVIFENTSTPREWRGPFQLPVNVPANSSFGTRSVFNGEARSPHSGADFPAPAGTPVAAPAAGVVALAAPLYFTGNTVVIDHGLGLYSVLAHLSVMSVSAGERVDAGQIVGRVGATGRVTSAHLHWSVRLNVARVDPLSLVAATSRKDARSRPAANGSHADGQHPR